MNESTTSNNNIIIHHEQIAQRAHRLWEQAGRPDGRDVEFWLQAEAVLRAEQESAAKASAKAPVKALGRVRRANTRAGRS